MPNVFFLGITFWFFMVLLFLFLLIARRFIQINLLYDFQLYARKLIKRSKKFSEHYQSSIDVVENQFLNLCSIFLFLFFVMLFLVFIK